MEEPGWGQSIIGGAISAVNDTISPQQAYALQQRGIPAQPGITLEQLKALIEQPLQQAQLGMTQAHTRAYNAQADREANASYNPQELEAIMSGDAAKIGEAFRGKIPKDAVGQSLSSDRLGATKEQQAQLAEERKYRHLERRAQESKNLVDKFNLDPSARRAQTMIDASSNIVGLIESGNPIAHSAIPTFMARASGEVGNLSEADKAPFGGSQALIARIKAVTQQAVSGKLTEENQKFVLELARLLDSKANQNLDKLARTRSKQYSKGNPFLSEEEIFSSLRPEAQSKAESKPQPKVMTESGGPIHVYPSGRKAQWNGKQWVPLPQ